MESKKLVEKLALIQEKLNVPKNLWNDYSKYFYRNAETILDAAKPVCRDHRATLIVRDEIIFIEGRHYVKAIAELRSWDSDEVIIGVAYAREPLDKKGMDSSQITGTASSYARKYALNGLFNLDDNKDADDLQPQTTTPATEDQLKKVLELCSPEDIHKVLTKLQKQDVSELTLQEASMVIEWKGGK